MWNKIKRLVPDKGALVIDAGACVGSHTRMFRASWPSARILSIEPHPGVREELQGVCAEAGARLFPVALGASELADAPLLPGLSHAMVSSFFPRSDGYDGIHKLGDPIPVQMRTLDGILEELGWPRVDFLKMDLQGYELEALKGAVRALSGGLVRVILSEVWWSPSYKGAPHIVELDAFLAPYGIRRLDAKVDTSEAAEGIWGDALYAVG